MLKPRLIPCLLVHDGGLIKTRAFREPKYVGDPLNAVRIFNEKEVDEMLVLDIDASRHNLEPDYKLIANLASECRMPLCYGGGVRTIEQFEKIVGLGVEKVAIASAAIKTPELVSSAASRVGSQSVVAVIDAKKSGIFRNQEVFINNGKEKTGLKPSSLASELENLGAGEIVLNSIDHDGMMDGYDFELIDSVRDAISTPLTVLGGAGSLDDISSLYKRYGPIGAARR